MNFANIESPQFQCLISQLVDNMITKITRDDRYYLQEVGKEAAVFLSDVDDIAASDGCASQSDALKTIRQKLSCAVCRGHA